MAKTKITIRIPPEVLDGLRECASRTGSNVSRLATELVIEGLGRRGGRPNLPASLAYLHALAVAGGADVLSEAYEAMGLSRRDAAVQADLDLADCELARWRRSRGCEGWTCEPANPSACSCDRGTLSG